MPIKRACVHEQSSSWLVRTRRSIWSSRSRSGLLGSPYGNSKRARRKLSHQSGTIGKLASKYTSLGATLLFYLSSPSTGRQSPDGDAASGKFSKQLRHSRRNFTLARDDYRPFQILSKLF